MAGYRWLEGLSTVDALYMTVITLSTVGFGEVKPLSPEGRMFTLALIVGGGGVAAYTLGSAADYVLSGEWRVFWRARRRKGMLAKLVDHVIVCGYGRVGRHVALTLGDEQLPFVIVDTDAEKIARLQADGLLAIEGNAANEAHLREAGIDRARSVVVAASSDAENVFIVLTVRSLRPDVFIVARANFEESEQKLLRAGANRVLMPYRIAGRRMVTMMMREDVADFLDEVAHAGGLELLLEQIEIEPASSLAGRTIRDAQLRQRLGVTVLAYRSVGGQLNTRPGADTRLEPGMRLIAIGTGDQLQTLMRLAQDASG